MKGIVACFTEEEPGFIVATLAFAANNIFNRCSMG
jgi:hypothetical protein